MDIFAKFCNTVQRLQQVLPTGKDGFDLEYEQLTRHDHSVKESPGEFFTARLAHNIRKNRYDDVLANESTRCQVVGVRSEDDYINANFVDPVGTRTCYICSQAPMPNTFNDFWNVVWYYGSRVILMLCSEVENGVAKCDRYWPPRVGGSDKYGDFRVVNAGEEHHGEYLVRKLDVTNSLNGEVRQVVHYHYLDWPDFGVPANALAMVDMLRSVDKLNSRYPEEDGHYPPIVCHCSAGIGRTGTLIAVHAALSRFDAGLDTDIFQVVKQLKEERSGMVQRKEQYMFIYMAVMKELQRCMGNAFMRDRSPPKPQTTNNRGITTPAGIMSPPQAVPNVASNGIHAPSPLTLPATNGTMPPQPNAMANGMQMVQQQGQAMKPGAQQMSNGAPAALPSPPSSSPLRAPQGSPTGPPPVMNGSTPYNMINQLAGPGTILNGSPSYPPRAPVTTPRVINQAPAPAASLPQKMSMNGPILNGGPTGAAPLQFPPPPQVRPQSMPPPVVPGFSGNYTGTPLPSNMVPPNPIGAYTNGAYSSHMQRYGAPPPSLDDYMRAGTEEEWRRASVGGASSRSRSASSGRAKNPTPMIPAPKPPSPRRQRSPGRRNSYGDSFDNAQPYPGKGNGVPGFSGFQESAPLREEPRPVMPRSPYNFGDAQAAYLRMPR